MVAVHYTLSYRLVARILQTNHLSEPTVMLETGKRKSQNKSHKESGEKFYMIDDRPPPV